MEVLLAAIYFLALVFLDILPTFLPIFIILSIGIYFINKIKPSKFLLKIKNIFILSFICILMIISVNLVGEIISDEIQLNKDTTSSCAWIGAIPRDWECQDNWEGSNRRLRAFNRSNPEQYIQINIGKSTDEHRCFSYWPIKFVFPHHVAGMPALARKCLGAQGNLLKANYNQEGYDFEVIGKGVSTKFYLMNLSEVSKGIAQGWRDDDLEGITKNYTYKTEFVDSNTVALINTNLCQKNDDGSYELKEKLYVSVDSSLNTMYGDGYPLYSSKLNVTIADPEKCILHVDISSGELEKGEHFLVTTVNMLTQVVDDSFVIQ